MYALDTREPEAASVGGMGNLGFSWLKYFRVTFDYGARKLYLLQRASFRPSSVNGDFGLELQPVKDQWVVRDVATRSSAAKAGIRPGDQLLDVDGVPGLMIGNQTPQLLKADAGETRTFRFRRNKDTVSATLVATPFP
jgi:predicted metalloprotease with PDZ domain